jgi:hypothetical protein
VVNPLNFDFLWNFDWEEIKKDPDKMAKVFMLISGAMIVSTILIVIGTIVFILTVLGLV